MGLDDIGLGIEVIIPDAFQQHGAGDDMPGMAHAQSVPTDTCADNSANTALATRFAQTGQAKIAAANAIGDLLGTLSNQASACFQKLTAMFSNIGVISDPA